MTETTTISMTELQKKLGLRHKPIVFRNLARARSLACDMRAGTVVMGEDEQFLIVVMSDAAKLIRAGYELVGR